jgi:hypothetical protein
MHATARGASLRVGATLGLAWLSVGCGPRQILATDGRNFQDCGPYVTVGSDPAHRPCQDALGNALLASAAHDLPCAPERIRTERLPDGDLFAVSGCGFRVVFRLVSTGAKSLTYEQISRSPLPASP